MARYHFKILKTSQLSKEMPYCFRYRLRDDILTASVKRSGVLMPIIVTEEDRPVVVAGHKRFFVARSLKMKEVPVIVAGKIKIKDAFLFSLISNWKQACSDMDRAQALGMAVGKFHFCEREILSVLMPLLGLGGDKALFEFYRKAEQFPPAFKDLIEDGQMSLRGVLPFLKFSGNDLDYFAKEIGAKLKLTSSQLLQSGEWMSDIMKEKGICLRDLCKKHKVLRGSGRRGMDPRTNADRFFAHIKRLRFPGYSLYHEEFTQRRADILRDAPEFRLEPVQGFEEPGFELHARVKTPGELDRLLRKLSLKHSALNSLFEIAL